MYIVLVVFHMIDGKSEIFNSSIEYQLKFTHYDLKSVLLSSIYFFFWVVFSFWFCLKSTSKLFLLCSHLTIALYLVIKLINLINTIAI